MAKDLEKSQLVKDFREAQKANGIKSKNENPQIGANGYTLGQTFTAEGLEIAYAESNGKKIPYFAITTAGGIKISVRSFMGLSSLNGYELSGEFTRVSRDKAKKPIEHKVLAQVVDDFDFSRCYQPPTRSLLDFVAWAEETNFFNDLTITYLGQVVRPFEAREDSKVAFDSYLKGDARVMTAKLWSIE
nr:MAG TPA: hypothetical protein [Caudoviricetes sp.]